MDHVDQISILVIEDDEMSACLVADHLYEAGYHVEIADTGEAAIRRWRNTRIDLIILDLGLPDMNGLEVLKRIRETDAYTPIIILTVDAHIQTKINAVNLDAPSFINKHPMNYITDDIVKLLKSHVRFVLQKSSIEVPICLESAGLILHIERQQNNNRISKSYQAYYHQKSVDLTLQDGWLLELFMRNPMHTLTYSRIDSWLPKDEKVDRRTLQPKDKQEEEKLMRERVRQAINRLKKALVEAEVDTSCIKNNRGTGYAFTEQVMKCNE